MASILLVDDNKLVLNVLAKILGQREYEVHAAQSGQEALKLLSEKPVDVVISDVCVQPMNGLQFLALVKKMRPKLPVVMMSGASCETSAVAAISAGAFDYIMKPIRVEDLETVIRNALNSVLHDTDEKDVTLPSLVSYRLGGIVAESPGMKKVCDSVEVAAIASTPALLCGEFGTGKSLLAHTIHERSPRKNAGFFELNCAELPEPVIARRLFGTAAEGKNGKERDTGAGLASMEGTILLKEVLMMPPGLLDQLCLHLSKGGGLSRKTNLILAADASVSAMSQIPEHRNILTLAGVVVIDLKPLRERTEDILPLLAHFFHERLGDWNALPALDPVVYSVLTHYQWPGNHEEMADLVNDISPLVKYRRITMDILPAGITALAARNANASGAFSIHGDQRGISLKKFLQSRLQKRAQNSDLPQAPATRGQPAASKQY